MYNKSPTIKGNLRRWQKRCVVLSDEGEGSENARMQKVCFCDYCDDNDDNEDDEDDDGDGDDDEDDVMVICQDAKSLI